MQFYNPLTFLTFEGYVGGEDLLSVLICLNCRYHLKDAVLEGGIPFNRAYGMTAFEYHGTDPRFNTVFNSGMHGHSTITMKKILEIYGGFEGLTSVVDVGGGTGAALNMIISKYPDIKGINFDLPHVIDEATSYPGTFSRTSTPPISLLVCAILK